MTPKGQLWKPYWGSRRQNKEIIVNLTRFKAFYNMKANTNKQKQWLEQKYSYGCNYSAIISCAMPQIQLIQNLEGHSESADLLCKSANTSTIYVWISSLWFWLAPIFNEFQNNQASSFSIILLTDKQTWGTENTTSLAEVKRCSRKNNQSIIIIIIIVFICIVHFIHKM